MLRSSLLRILSQYGYVVPFPGESLGSTDIGEDLIRLKPGMKPAYVLLTEYLIYEGKLWINRSLIFWRKWLLITPGHRRTQPCFMCRKNKVNLDLSLILER